MLNLTASHDGTQQKDLTPQITVVGVGGAGCNAVNNMIASKLEGVRFIACNTDAQALTHSLAPMKMQIGTQITSGLGAGSKPDIGRAAAEESLDDVMAQLEGANMVFVTAGMGGGTGTGAAPVIARAAKEAGILTVGVVTKPFHFEGAHRMRMAEAGLEEMQDYVDTLIVIPNQNLFRIANEKTTFADAFKLADSVLQSGVRGVTDLMMMPGLINLDFADVRCAMMEMGKAMMGTGDAEGERRAIDAAERAINNPLLDDVSMKGARGVIINISGGTDMTLFEVDEACNRIRDEVDADANIIFGSTFDESLDGLMRVTVLATGIESEMAKRTRPIRGTNTNTVSPQQVQQQQMQQSQAQQQSQVQQHTYQPATAPSTPHGGGMQHGAVINRQHQLVVPPMHTQVSSPSFVQQGASMQKNMHVGASSSESGDLSRGVRHGGAFIPPQPVNPETGRAYTTVGNAAVAIEDDVQTFDVSPVAAERPSALQLNPPVPGERSHKRPPSLFEKIAGMFTESDDDIERGDDGSGSGSAGSQGGLFSGFSNRGQNEQNTPMQSAPRQQQSAPVATPASSTTGQQQDLEIPAFLRRQIS